MPSYVLRVWMPDRPGALGAVASRIGAVRGDLIGVEILERGGGRAIDELVVELPAADLVPLLLEEVGEVDGVDVEEIRSVVTELRDPRLDALETAAALVAQATPGQLLSTLVEETASDFEADWVTVIDLDASSTVVAFGDAPPVAWLSAFVGGMGAAASVARQPTGPDDVACADIEGTPLVLVMGRGGRPCRARERRQLAALARIAGHRWAELGWRGSVRSHPAGVL